jgi:methyl-accepting chemotaxis protein
VQASKFRGLKKETFMAAWKLRGRLTVFGLCTGLLPLLLAILYVGHKSSFMLEEQSIDYLKSEVNSFARMADVRYSAIMENLNVDKIKTLKSDLIALAAKEKYYKTGYIAIFTPDGTCLYHPKSEFRNNTTLYNSYKYIKDGVNQREGVFRYKADGIDEISYIAYVNGLNWVVWSVVPESEVLAKVNSLKIELYIFLALTSLIVSFLGAFIAGRISRRAKEISNYMKGIAEGEANLSARLPVLTTDEVGEIASWFNKFVEHIEEVIRKVKNTAMHVDISTQEVAAGAQGLSQATQQQASAIEEVAATIEEMTSSIKHNAENASDGRQKANEMVRMANSSGESAQDLVRAMGEISEASKKIGDIITTVNEVAFQTNLLALNAAVEAARAGEHGKGFAVVAEEVRALAQRSADASKQIKTLIEDTVNKIGAGDIMVKKSGESLEQIIKHIQELSQVMEEIAAASGEQASGVDELNRAVTQIDSTTQQNASTVEELASTSDSLSNEAKDLSETVTRFTVSQTEQETKEFRQPPKKQTHIRHEPAKPVSALKQSEQYDEDFEEF